jgi:hypothetical protein
LRRRLQASNDPQYRDECKAHIGRTQQLRYVAEMRYVILLTLPLLLIACNNSSAPSGAGGVSASEAKALDEAAEMIEAKRLPEEALRPPTAQPAPPPAAK